MRVICSPEKLKGPVLNLERQLESMLTYQTRDIMRNHRFNFVYLAEIMWVWGNLFLNENGPDSMTMQTKEAMSQISKVLFQFQPVGSTFYTVFPFHAPLEICNLYFVIDFVHKKPYHANILVYKVNGKKKVADFKGSMKRKHRTWLVQYSTSNRNISIRSVGESVLTCDPCSRCHRCAWGFFKISNK